jgi:glycosyltransferase involved in cell wall biosynthesis
LGQILAMIEKSYVLFTRIPLTRTSDGKLYCDPLWAKDLNLHFDYIRNFHLCCPVVISNKVDSLEPVTHEGLKQVFALRKDYGLVSVMLNVLPNFLTAFKAARHARIAHSGGAGWAFPLSFYLTFLKPFMSFKWIILIESSFWMLDPEQKSSFRNWVNHHLHKHLLTRCLKQADVRIFTQSFYRDYFLKGQTQRTLIAPATWVDENKLVTEEQLQQRFEGRKGNTLELIYPTRLIRDKGVYVLFDAVKELQSMGVRVNITIMGVGELEGDCQRFASEDHGSVKVTFRQKVSYGEPFYEVLCEHDILLVLNLKEEQPRIIFDAFSQGLGVIASDTSGVMDVVKADVNALPFKRGESQVLAKVIADLVAQPQRAAELGHAGLICAQGKNHLAMHQQRLGFFEQVLGSEWLYETSEPIH